MPVVLVHGLAVSSRYFVPTAAHLAPHHPVWAPDLPGWGRSGKPDHVLSLAELAGVLARWMALNGINHAALIGNSMGCQIVAHLAVEYPRLVERVVLIGPTMDRVGRNVPEQACRLTLDMLREPFWSWLIHARDLLDFGLVRLWKTLAFALADPLEALLPRIQQPALIVRGEHDPIAPRRWAEEVVAFLPDARLDVIRGGTHAVNTSAPGPLVSVLLPFLASGVGRVLRPFEIPSGLVA